jgi:hypothetical protein
MRRIALSAVTLSTLIACGGGASQKGAEPPTVAVAKSTTPSTGTVDPGPVRFPEGLVAWGRIARPSALVKGGAAWIHKSEQEVAKELSASGKEVGADLVALDQPIDGALILTGASYEGVKGAVSFTVNNVPAAKDTLGKKAELEVLSDGTIHAKLKKGGGDEPDEDSAAAKRSFGCMVHADGHTVCGDESVLGVLDSFLLRDVPRLGAKADIHVEVRMQPIRDVAGPALAALADLGKAAAAGEDGEAGDASKEAAKKSKEEAKAFLEDIDTLQYDGSFNENQLRTEISVDLRSKKSLFSQWIAEPGNAPVLSNAFGAVAAQADMSLWAAGGRSLLAQQGKPLLQNALKDDLKHLKEADRPKAEALLGQLYDTLFTFRTAALGRDDGALGKLADAATGPKASAAAKKRLAAAAVGDEQLWMTASFATPFASARDLILAVDKMPDIKDPKKKKTDEKKYPSKITALPKGSAFPANSVYFLSKKDVKDKNPPAPVLDKSGKPVKGKDKGAEVLGTLDTMVVIAPMGEETWVFVGDSLPMLEGVYKQALAGKPAARPQPGTLGGAAFAPKLWPADKIDDNARAPEVISALLAERAKIASAPSMTGETILGNSGNRSRITFRFDVPRTAFEAYKAFDDKGIGKKP